MYTDASESGLNRKLTFSDAWIQMIKDNTVSILGWIQCEKVKCLQNNNPEVPGLIYNFLHSIWANQELYRKGNSDVEFYNILEKNMRHSAFEIMEAYLTRFMRENILFLRINALFYPFKGTIIIQ